MSTSDTFLARIWIKAGRMEPGRKFGYFIFVAGLVALPLHSFAEATGPNSQAPNSPTGGRSSSDLLTDKIGEEPLLLSLSRFMSVPSFRQAPKFTVATGDSVTAYDEIHGEPLLLSLSHALSLSSIPLVIKDQEANVAIQDKGQSESEPGSRESLFGDIGPTKGESEPGSRESLFGDIGPTKEKVTHVPAWKKLATGWRGFSQLEIADNYSSPEHLSKAKLRTELSRTGQFNEYVKWKISGRFDYDAAYDVSNFYPPAVRQDQRYDFFLRENYLDISAGNFDFRLGRQHVIWGEMVGLFFADVVSARDMREFILPSFDIMRIPQWAMRAEYTKNNLHAEVLWIPVATLDIIGKPGADFYPFPLRDTASFLPEDRSGRNVGNSNYGVRLSYLKNGWDMSGFYYHSLDASPTFHRVSGFAEPLVFQARHGKIDQVGATFAKDFGSIVLKGELVYTDGRKFNVTRPSAIDGLVRQNTLDYVLGLDFSLPAETRLNLQFFQRVYFGHDPHLIPDKRESGASILLNGKVWHKLEAQALMIHSLNRSDWMFRPRLTWNFEKNWRWALGADVFGGEPTGLFGRFENNDRVYTEMRFSF